MSDDLLLAAAMLLPAIALCVLAVSDLRKGYAEYFFYSYRGFRILDRESHPYGYWTVILVKLAASLLFLLLGIAVVTARP